ncbi:phage tail protein [Serratia fonticola]|uniref:phage tail protein n=1 Tax=Serratia fonticola TaxID=47917 RepID=UPI0015C5C6E6|nr:phage tail protein [Serratia fonticola]NXZ86286.1 phage tail protein [Serratia fonticola]
MSQLDELYAFIKANLPERLMRTVGADAWMDDIELIHAAKDWGLDQRRVAIRKYTATLAWERWPYREYDPDVLFALVMVWLAGRVNQHYDHLEFPAPSVFVELMNDRDAIITIDVPLADDIILTVSDEGIVPIKDKSYVVAQPTVNVATAGWITGTGSTAAPVAGK